MAALTTSASSTQQQTSSRLMDDVTAFVAGLSLAEQRRLCYLERFERAEALRAAGITQMGVRLKVELALQEAVARAEAATITPIVSHA